MTNGLNSVAGWFDRFFGDPRGDPIDEEASAYLHLVLDGFYSGVPGEDQARVRVRGGADLPRFENRLRLIVTSDADSTVTGRDLTGIEAEPDEREDESGGVGLALRVSDDPQHRFSLGAGLAGGLSPEAVVTARYRYLQPLTASTRLRLTPTLYMRSGRGAGASAVFDYEWFPQHDTLWRYTAYGNYRERKDQLDWSTQGSWQHRLNERSAIATRFGVRGQAQPQEVLREGWANLSYRRRLGKPWLFVELEPGLSWHETVDYRTEPTMALRLEIQFREF